MRSETPSADYRTDLMRRMADAATPRRSEICDHVFSPMQAGERMLVIDQTKTKITAAVLIDLVNRAGREALEFISRLKAEHAASLVTLSREADAARAERDSAIEDARSARRALDPDRQQRDTASAVKSATVALELEVSTLRSQMASMRDELNNLRAQKRAWRKAKP